MLINDHQYLSIIENIKSEIGKAQYKAILHVNRELILLYYEIGKIINEHKSWGNKFIDNLAKDIKLAFPDSTGYSARNLKYMAKFAAEYTDAQIVQEVLAQITWYHNLALMDKLHDTDTRIWYAKKVCENGWSRNVLVHQIETKLYERQVLANKITNFENRLPSPQSELAVQTIKDPYVFDFIPFKEHLLERDIEKALIKNITALLLELGTGFAFVGNQYRLNVGGDNFYIDLLFYNINLRCYVVIELKTGDLRPEYAGQLNFYLSAVDGLLKKDEDMPTIGLLLCQSKNNIVAEYALKDISKPMGVSEYRMTGHLPKELENQLPSVEDIQKHIGLFDHAEIPIELIKYAKKSVDIIAPFIDIEYCEEIRKLSQDIYIRLITSEHSVPQIAEYISKINDANVHFEVKYVHDIHSKLLIVDDQVMMAHSMNLAKRRKPHSGNESYVIRDDTEYVDDELNAFNSLWANAQKIQIVG